MKLRNCKSFLGFCLAPFIVLIGRNSSTDYLKVLNKRVIINTKWTFFIGIALLMLTCTAILLNLQIVSVLRIHVSERSVPLCTEGILSKKSITMLPWNRFDENMPLTHKDGTCRLHYYSKVDIVNCVEALNEISTFFDANRNDPDAMDDGIKSAFYFMNRDKSDSLVTNPFLGQIHDQKTTTQDVTLRVSFMGDSRIHQMYLNFIMQLVPFFENRCPAASDNKHYRYDKCGATPLMNADFSYHDFAFYDNKYMKVVTDWIDGLTMAPNYLIIGSTAHHIGKLHPAVGGKIGDFTGNITQLANLLIRLEERYGTRMIWWMDDMTPDDQLGWRVQPGISDGGTGVLKLSNMVHQIFQENQVPIQIWDSANDFYMSFARTCSLSSHNVTRREVPWIAPPFIAHPNSWIKCKEMLHAPQAYALHQAQLLANDLCNRVLTT